MPIGKKEDNLDREMTPYEAAEFLATTRKTLESWRVHNRGPDYLKQGRSVRYRIRDLLAFQNRNLVHTEKRNGSV